MSMKAETAEEYLKGPRMRSKPRRGHALTASTLGTFTGLRVDPAALDANLINIPDIAHSLSLQCRFGGHCKEFYSVAQHSVEVSRQVPAEFALWGLLHDASEAYLCDLPRPVKALFPEYKKLELEIQEIIAAYFGLPWPMPKEIHIADAVELLTEAKCFHEVPVYDSELTHRQTPLISQAPVFAERSFLQRYKELTR